MNINILWDFDGTIFDTYPAFVKSFLKLSENILEEVEVLKWLKIDSKKAFKHFGIDEEKRERYKELYNEESNTSSKPFPYVESVLSSANKNFIVTHRDKQSTIHLLEKYNLKHFFDEIVSVEEDGFLRKPDTSSYQSLLNKYEINLVIGDRELDLSPAKQLGIKTVSFQNDNIEADYHIKCYSDFIIIFLTEYFCVQRNKVNTSEITPNYIKSFFEPKENRLKHILKVAKRMDNSTSALLHDIGYSKKVIRTNFHPLDGALFAIELNCSPSDIKNILFHSMAEGEAFLRGGEIGLIYKIAKKFLTIEDKTQIDKLSYIDMTTSSTGEIITIEERINDIISRYPKDSIVYQNVCLSTDYINYLKSIN